MIIIAVETGILPAQAALLAKWRFDPAINQLEFTLDEETTPNYFLLANPPRLVVELPNTQVGKVASKETYSGVVREIRVGQFQEDVTRIVLELAPEVILAPGLLQLEKAKPEQGNDRWLIRPLIASTSAPTLAPPLANTTTQQPAVSIPPTTQPSNTLPNTSLPPATFGSPQPTVVNVPPLVSPTVNPGEPTRNPTPSSEPSKESVIQFGQPLPQITPAPNQPQSSLPILQPAPAVLPEENSANSPIATTPLVVPTLNSASAVGTTTEQVTNQSPDILLSTGTQISLRYPGNSLTLTAGSPQPAELVLQEDLRSQAGNLIAPAGTPVRGRFETNDTGSRFIATALALQNQNIPLAAQSDILNGNPTASKSATLKPSQIIQIRLSENLLKF
jgi:N-acetylmuramoyl-L-alanine amidase